MSGADKSGPRRQPDEAKLNSLVSAMADSQAKARAEAEKREAQVKKTRGRKLHPLVPVVLLIPLAAILYYNLNRPLTIPPVPADISAKETVYVTALALSAEFDETGAYPASLEAIGMDEDGLRYVKTGAGYVLTAEEDSVRVEYQAGQDLGAYKAAFEMSLPPFEEVK